jgi:hypothetical protein
MQYGYANLSRCRNGDLGWNGKKVGDEMNYRKDDFDWQNVLSWVLSIAFTAFLTYWIFIIPTQQADDCRSRHGMYVNNTRGSSLCYASDGKAIIKVY